MKANHVGVQRVNCRYVRKDEQSRVAQASIEREVGVHNEGELDFHNEVRHVEGPQNNGYGKHDEDGEQGKQRRSFQDGPPAPGPAATERAS